MNSRVDILGMPLDTQPRASLLEKATTWLKEREGRFVATLNPEMVLYCQKDEELRSILKKADLAIPDGTGIVWAAKKLHDLNLIRYPGIEFAEDLLAHCTGEKMPLFLLGSRPGVANKAAARLLSKYPLLSITGTHHGYFTPEEEAAISVAIQETRPALLIVGMGIGKQERFINSLPRGTFGVAVGVGGAIEIWSGEKKRAPRWIRNCSLEWLYRLLVDPRRLLRLFRMIPFFWRIQWQYVRHA